MRPRLKDCFDGNSNVDPSALLDDGSDLLRDGSEPILLARVQPLLGDILLPTHVRSFKPYVRVPGPASTAL